MAAPSVNFCYGNGLQQSPQQPYCQPPVPLFPCNVPLPQPLFNSNPWVAQCMPPVQCHYQQQQQQQLVGTNYKQQTMRGRGKNWHRQNHPNKLKRQDRRNSMNTGTKDFHCETCKSSFHTKFDLNGHMSQHRQCIHPGCNFMAVTRVLKEHEMVHRIPKELLFTSEEEIAKWREERRRKYPTVARVKEKLAEEEAKVQRGETAKDDVYRYRKRGGADYGYPGAKRGRGGRGRFHGRPHGQDRRSGERSLHPSESLDGNSECTLDQLTNSLAKDTGVTGHSSSQQKPKAPILQNTSRHKATLLEKLLTPEIRQERNTILQCIRHIVKKNFFSIEGSSSDAETSNEANDCDVSTGTCANDGQPETFSSTKCEDQIPSS